MNPQLLDRYFANECTVKEAEQVLAWLATAEGQHYLQQRMDASFWQPPDPLQKIREPDSERIWRRLQHAQAVQEEPQQRPWWTGFRRYAAAAATLLLVAASAVWLYQNSEPTEIVQRTEFGQTKTITLPDKSTIVLNSNSMVRYQPSWTANDERQVWVEGEAFFKVVHTANHQRFVVHLPGKVNVEVLGTEFDVYARKTKTRVVLNSGKIKLNIKESTRQPVIMKPGELIETDTQARLYKRRSVNAEVYSSWQTDKLSFDRTSLSEVIQLLEETYGLRVQVQDRRLLIQQISGSVKNQNIDVLLDGLEQLFDLNVERTGNTVIIHSTE